MKNKICKLNFLSVPVRTNCCLYLTCTVRWTAVEVAPPAGPQLELNETIQTERCAPLSEWGRSELTKQPAEDPKHPKSTKERRNQPTSRSRGDQLTAAEGFVFVKHTEKRRAEHLNTPKTRLQQISDQNKWQTSPISWSSASRRPRE